MVNFTPWRKPQAVDQSAVGSTATSTQGQEKDAPRRKWNLGILSDPQTDEVPGKKVLYRLFYDNGKLMPSSQAPLSFFRKRTTATNR
jgi:hypothetical protein